MKKNNKIIGAGLLTAIASSLCCITPLLALVSGTTGIASNFSWLEPFRPYLIGFTILVLSFAWYQKLKPKKEINCNCETEEKPSFFQSKLFLAIVTVFAFLMTILPYYSNVFYPKHNNSVIRVIHKEDRQTINLKIKGMTCNSCEEHINHSVYQLDGVINAKSSYKNGNANIEFDNSKTTVKDIEKAINSTGYTVINTNKK